MSTLTTPERSAPRGLRRTVAPTIQLVDINSLKAHGRIDIDEENVLLLEYLEAATDYAESYQERCLRLSTWQATYDCFPCSGVFYLPMPRLVSVTGITYLDAAGDSQTLATSVYTVDVYSEPGRVALKSSQVWPTTLDQINAVTVTFTAGYAAAADVPARTRQAIRVLAQHMWLFREPIVTGASVANVPMSVIDLLNEDRLVSYR